MKKLMSSLFTLVLVFMGIMLFTPSVFAAEPSASDSVDVTLTAVFDSENNLVLNELDLKYGDEITIDDFGTVTEYEFDFWIVNGVVRTDLPQATTFLATDDMQLTAVFHPSDETEFYVVFIDSNGHVDKAEFVEKDEATTAPLTAGFSKPNFVVANPAWVSVKGSQTPAAITEASVFRLAYVVDQAAVFNVSVPEGATVSNATPQYNEIVTISTDDPEFVAWLENGQVVSFDPVFKFTALMDREFEMSTDATDLAPVVTLHELELRSGHASYLGQVYLPEGATLIEAGILGSNTVAMPTYGAEDVTVIKSNALQPTTLEFLRTIADDTNFEVVRAYAVVKFEDEIVTVYSFIEEEPQVELIKLPTPVHGLGHQPRPVAHLAFGSYDFDEGANGGFVGHAVRFTNLTTSEVFVWNLNHNYKQNADAWYTEVNLAAAGIVLTPGNYSLTYFARGNGTTTTDSDDKSTGITFVIALPQLNNPVLTLNDTTLSWSAVANATSYEVYVNNVLTAFTSSPVDLSYLDTPDVYTVKVLAKAEGYQNGQATINYVVLSQEAQPLPAPTNLVEVDGILTWDAVPNAIGYVVRMNGIIKNANSNTYDLSQFFLAGTFNVEVMALGNGVDELDSEWSDSISVNIAAVLTPLIAFEAGDLAGEGGGLVNTHGGGMFRNFVYHAFAAYKITQDGNAKGIRITVFASDGTTQLGQQDYETIPGNWNITTPGFNSLLVAGNIIHIQVRPSAQGITNGYTYSAPLIYTLKA